MAKETQFVKYGIIYTPALFDFVEKNTQQQCSYKRKQYLQKKKDMYGKIEKKKN